MEVRKESNGLKNSMVTREELAIINQFTKRALKEDEVYTLLRRRRRVCVARERGAAQKKPDGGRRGGLCKRGGR